MEDHKSIKALLDGKLVDQPEISSGNGFIPVHQDVPSVGMPSGSFGLDEFGAFLGSFDDIRVYDRGLSANEIAQVYAGDANQIDWLNTAWLKNQINTLPLWRQAPVGPITGKLGIYWW